MTLRVIVMPVLTPVKTIEGCIDSLFEIAISNLTGIEQVLLSS